MAGRKKKRDFSKLVVLLILTLNVTFTAAILVLFWYAIRKGIEVNLDALIYSFFFFTTGELAALCGIKVSKVRRSFNPLEDDSESND